MSPEACQPATPGLPRPHTRTVLVRTWVRDLVVSLGISAFFIIFLYQPVKVEGTSMLPGLEDQERIFVNKFVYRWEPVARGDVVVFRYPRDISKSYIKRIIAVPGDRVAIDKGRVYINGLLLREDYVPAEFRDQRSYPETVIPPGSYFVMGDHRSLSSDSRDFGAVNERYVIGKAVFIYWPFEKLGLLR
jgi:signal peptidase I